MDKERIKIKEDSLRRKQVRTSHKSEKNDRNVRTRSFYLYSPAIYIVNHAHNRARDFRRDETINSPDLLKIQYHSVYMHTSTVFN